MAQSLFDTKSNAPPTPSPTPPPGEPTPDTKVTADPPAQPTEPVVRMPDGTEVPVDQYVRENAPATPAQPDIRTIAEVVKEVTEASKPDPDPKPAEKPSWKVDIDNDTFQSDAEKSIAEGHNALGDEVTSKIASVDEKLDKVSLQIEEVGKTTTEDRNQREIDDVLREKGITESDLKAVYNEYNGEIRSIPALAEMAASRKSTSDASEERTKVADADRRDMASKVSGGGEAAGTETPTDEPGRGLAKSDIYSGAKIAEKYNAHL